MLPSTQAEWRGRRLDHRVAFPFQRMIERRWNRCLMAVAGRVPSLHIHIHYTYCIYIFTFFRSHCEIQEHQLKMKMFEGEEAKRNGSELHAVSGKPVVPPPLPVAVGDNVVLREVWQEQARLLIKQVWLYITFLSLFCFLIKFQTASWSYIHLCRKLLSVCAPVLYL